MEISCIKWPDEQELKLCKRCAWVTQSNASEPKEPPRPDTLKGWLRARHSQIRVLQFAFLLDGIPSNTATHFARHVHAQPFVSSLRNDRQGRIDGDTAPRNTPVQMILYCNAEELMSIANKRLCAKASPMTRQVARMMCDAAAEKLPEIKDFLVPMCIYHGGVCHEINGCGRCIPG